MSAFHPCGENDTIATSSATALGDPYTTPGSHHGQRPLVNMFAPCCPEDIPPRGRWSADNFVIKNLLGKGFASQVYLAVDVPTQRTVALKVYYKNRLSPLYQHQVFREIHIHAKMCHENIVQLYGAFEDHRAFFLIMEYASGGDLYSHFKRSGSRYSELCVVRSILTPFLSALQYIHSKDVIHRDIKPENCVLTSSGQIKITDFGLSIESTCEVATTRLGTLDYMAPEVARNPDTLYVGQYRAMKHLHYGASCDAWAVGTLAYEMLIGRPPFWATNKAKQVKKIQCQEVTFPPWVNSLSRDFIRSALTKNPKKRSSVPELMRHSWLTTNAANHSLCIQQMPPPPAARPAIAPCAQPLLPIARAGVQPLAQASQPAANATAPVNSVAVDEDSPQQTPRQAHRLRTPRGDMESEAHVVPAVQGASPKTVALPPSPFDSPSEAEQQAKLSNLRSIRSAVALLNAYGGADEHAMLSHMQRSGSVDAKPPQPQMTMMRRGFATPSDSNGLKRGGTLSANGNTQWPEGPRLQPCATVGHGMNKLWSPNTPGQFPTSPQGYGGVINGGAPMGSAPIKMKSLVDELLESESQEDASQHFFASNSSRTHSVAGSDTHGRALFVTSRSRTHMGDVSEEEASMGSLLTGQSPTAIRPYANASGSLKSSFGGGSDGKAYSPASIACNRSALSICSEGLASVPEGEKSILDCDDGSSEFAPLVTQRSGPFGSVRCVHRSMTHHWSNAPTSEVSPQPLTKPRSALTLALSPASCVPESSCLTSLDLSSEEFGTGSEASPQATPDLLALPPRVPEPLAWQPSPRRPNPAPACAVVHTNAAGPAAPAERMVGDFQDLVSDTLHRRSIRPAAQQGAADEPRMLVLLPPEPAPSNKCPGMGACRSLLTKPSVKSSPNLRATTKVAGTFRIRPVPSEARKTSDLKIDALLPLASSEGRRASTGGMFSLAFSHIKRQVVRLARRVPGPQSLKACAEHEELPAAVCTIEGKSSTAEKPCPFDAVLEEGDVVGELMGPPRRSADDADLAVSLLHVRSTVSSTVAPPSLLDMARSVSAEGEQAPVVDTPRWWSDVLSLLPNATGEEMSTWQQKAVRMRAKTTTFVDNGCPMPLLGLSPPTPRAADASGGSAHRPSVALDLVCIDEIKYDRPLSPLAESSGCASCHMTASLTVATSPTTGTNVAKSTTSTCDSTSPRSGASDKEQRLAAALAVESLLQLVPGPEAKRRKKQFWMKRKQAAMQTV